MRHHTQRYRDMIKSMGRTIDFFITYRIDNQDYILDDSKLISISPYFEANLLKSVMKQLDFETTELIPKGTIINARLGVLVGGGLTVKEVHEMKVKRLNETPVSSLAPDLDGFEYMEFGNYVVAEEPTYNADTQTYTYKTFDKMIYSMVDYETMNITYPITIRDYINTICTKLGLTFKNVNDEFANYNKEIHNELYLDSDGKSLGYTFRDVLDELAQVTASIICINEATDELEIRYPTETEDTINEEFLKDTDVKFDEKYGAINVIVLSRSAGADNIYYPETLPENPCELKIEDNQIMNFDDRDTYMPDIYNKLNGLEYYINDFNSTGITWYELGDMYNVQIGEDTYKCLMLNDEINIQQGLEEIIHTDMPEESETDYKKADTTDRRVKKTILQVNKQEGQIQGIIEDIGDRSQKSTSITQDIDGIQSIVEDIEDVTNDADGTKEVILNNCIEGPLLELHIYGNNTVFDYLRCGNDIITANNLYPYGDSRIQVVNYPTGSEEGTETGVYDLGITDVLRQNGNVYDEYVLEKGVAKVIRRINTDGTIKTNETIEELGEFSIPLLEGDNVIRIKNYTARLKVKYAIKNDFTDVFATKVEMSSSITQTAEEINTEVRKKVDENEVISKINQSAEQIQINANKISLEREKYKFNRR